MACSRTNNAFQGFKRGTTYAHRDQYQTTFDSKKLSPRALMTFHGSHPTSIASQTRLPETWGIPKSSMPPSFMHTKKPRRGRTFIEPPLKPPCRRRAWEPHPSSRDMPLGCVKPEVQYLVRGKGSSTSTAPWSPSPTWSRRHTHGTIRINRLGAAPQPGELRPPDNSPRTANMRYLQLTPLSNLNLFSNLCPAMPKPSDKRQVQTKHSQQTQPKDPNPQSITSIRHPWPGLPHCSY